MSVTRTTSGAPLPEAIARGWKTPEEKPVPAWVPGELTLNPGLVGRGSEGCRVLAMLKSELRRGETRMN